MASAIRQFSCALALMLATCAAAGQVPDAPRSYAIMSLAGNAITVHGVRQQVGLHVAADTATVFPITEQIFDTAALSAADGILKQLVPGATPVLLLTSDEGLYKAQNAMFEAPLQNEENRAYLRSLLKDRGVTHLLLVTRQRDHANFRLRNGHAGSGMLEGLGFFVDELFETINKTTNERSTGMVVPFAYVKVRLLDAQTLEELGQTKATVSHIIVKPAATATSDAIWQGMSSGEKTAQLRTMLACAMQNALPVLVPAGSSAIPRCQ